MSGAVIMDAAKGFLILHLLLEEVSWNLSYWQGLLPNLVMSINYLVSEAACQIAEKGKMKSGIQTGFVAALDSFI